MTSPPQPTPGEGRSAGQILRPLRDIAAYALVGATALLLFVAIIRLIPDGGAGYSYRTQDSFYGFVNLATIFFPLAAVLLALVVQPRHPKANLIVLAAVVEYAVAAFFGVIFGLLIGVINHASNNGVRTAFEELLVRLAWLAVLGVAAYGVFLIWRGLFQVPKPKAPQGVYGQPPQYNAGAYPGQPGYGPPPQQPGYPPQQHPGYPQQPAPPQPGGFQPGGPQQGGPQPGGPQPGGPQQGYPPQQPPQPGYGAPTGGYGQPAPPPPTWNPEPASGPPQSGPYPPHFGGGPAASDPTQVVPSREEDRTEKLRDDRPGFGPADQDPLRH